MRKLYSFLLITGILSACSSPEQPVDTPLRAPAASPRFSISTLKARDLGTLGGQYSEAHAINDLTQVVGEAEPSGASGIVHAFFWEMGVMSDLGTLPGWPLSRAFGMNGSGLVVGYSGSDTPYERHATYWPRSGGALQLPQTPGSFGARAFGVNAGGQVVGVIDFGGEFPAFWPSPQSPPRVLPSAAGSTGGAAYAINSRGDAVGSTGPHAAYWPAGGGVIDLGTLGGVQSVAWGINDAGQVVGSSVLADGVTWHGFYWIAPNGPMADLGPYELTSINRAGQASGLGGGRAGAWTLPSTATDIGTLAGGTFALGNGINNRAQIVGASTGAANSSTHATLWDLVLDSTAALPIINIFVSSPISLSGARYVGVTMLSRGSFDASVADARNITLGNGDGNDTYVSRGPNNQPLKTILDYDGDGLLDLVVRFKTSDMVQNGDLTAATKVLILHGSDPNNGTYQASAPVTVVP